MKIIQNWKWEEESGIPACMSFIGMRWAETVEIVTKGVLEWYLKKPGFQMSKCLVEERERGVLSERGTLLSHMLVKYEGKGIVSVILELEKEKDREFLSIIVNKEEGCEEGLWEKIMKGIKER